MRLYSISLLHRTCSLIAVLLLSLNLQAAPLLKSPSGNLTAEVQTHPEYLSVRLVQAGSQVVTIRTLQFDWVKNPQVGAWTETKASTSQSDETWQTVYGEQASIRNHYQEMTLRLQSNDNDKQMEVCLRLYDEGLAFRYSFVEEDFWNYTLKDERTQFLFEQDCATWATASAQGVYGETTLSRLNFTADRPQVVQVNPQCYVAIGEAALVDYARMKLKRSTAGFGLQSALSGEVKLGAAGYHSPWRYVMVADHPGRLVENNALLLNLNEPCKIEDTSWIRPGQVLREVTLTTEGGLACVNYAARHRISYVEFDAGWYGPENNPESDATTITVDTARSKGTLDLHRIIRTADSLGVGIILYVNRHALHQQLDEILPLYKKWGVKGLKFGFVDVGSQESTTWLHHAVRLAAKYQLMVDIHDEYRPTGYSRTYPNLMTQEGIRGDEESPALQQAIFTFYNRMIAGAGDYTNCYHDGRVAKKMGGRAAQLAKRVAIYSPWQFVYWYDRPETSPRRMGGAGNSEDIIHPDAMTDFYESIPTVWDETRFVEGKMGDYLVVARRKGTHWYVAVLNAGGSRTITLPELFNSRENYQGDIYYQPNSQEKETISTRHLPSGQARQLQWTVAGNTGCLIHLYQ